MLREALFLVRMPLVAFYSLTDGVLVLFAHLNQVEYLGCIFFNDTSYFYIYFQRRMRVNYIRKIQNIRSPKDYLLELDFDPMPLLVVTILE